MKFDILSFVSFGSRELNCILVTLSAFVLGHLFLTGQTGESEMSILSVGKDRLSSHLVGQLCLWFCMVVVLNPCGAKALATCC